MPVRNALPATALAQKLFAAAAANRAGDFDHAALAGALEVTAHHGICGRGN